jgi:predicted enzyme related to lactoylglutathione lyase
MVTNLGAVIIFTRQFAESRRFYEQALGLTAGTNESDHYVEYPVGQGTWALHRSDTDVRGSGAVHLHLITDSLDRLITEAARYGVHPLAPVAKQPWGIEAAFEDPTGIVVDVVEPPAVP